ncbi:MAG: hypothetical protein ABIN74_00900 [Ferruginibacter sp.]
MGQAEGMLLGCGGVALLYGETLLSFIEADKLEVMYINILCGILEILSHSTYAKVSHPHINYNFPYSWLQIKQNTRRVESYILSTQGEVRSIRKYPTKGCKVRFDL